MGMQAIGRWLGEPKKVALLLLAAGLAAVAALGVVASAASAAEFSNNSGITINDGSAEEFCENGAAATIPGTATPYPSTIPVTTFPEGSSITDVNVTVRGLTHEFPDDAGLLLVSPEGPDQKSVILMADSGGNVAVSGITLTFDDDVSDPVPDNAELVSETYRPSQGTTVFSDECTASFPAPAPDSPYGTSLSVFNGTDPTGDWQLYVIDDTFSFAGSITGWSLVISTAPTVPMEKADCKNGDWRGLGWPDQGTCISAWNNQNRP
jgi:subtilisin-like proprotein convertase family protein